MIPDSRICVAPATEWLSPARGGFGVAAGARILAE